MESHARMAGGAAKAPTGKAAPARGHLDLHAHIDALQQVTRIEPVITAKTARARGLTIPPSILGRAGVVE